MAEAAELEQGRVVVCTAEERARLSLQDAGEIGAGSRRRTAADGQIRWSGQLHPHLRTREALRLQSKLEALQLSWLHNSLLIVGEAEVEDHGNWLRLRNSRSVSPSRLAMGQIWRTSTVLVSRLTFRAALAVPEAPLEGKLIS